MIHTAWFQKLNKNIPLWVVLLSIGTALITFCVCYFLFYRENILVEERVIDSAYMKKENDAYRSLNMDPQALQILFEADVRSGSKDEHVKSHAYFLLNRYFNTGGNIYEIYDYVNSRPSLAFMKQAENIYPPVFQSIRDRALPSTFSTEGMYAYLAYIEALDRAGYAGVVARSTAAHEYAQMAYAVTKQPEQLSPGVNVTQNIQFKINKALFFAEAARDDVAGIVDGTVTSDEILRRDMVVGLSHYAVAMRYFQALGVEFTSPKTSAETFDFSMREAKRDFPSLEPFTSLLNASSLLLDEASTAEEVKIALEPLLRVDMANTDVSQINTLRRIVESRNEETRYLKGTTTALQKLDVFGKANIRSLAIKVPEFRTWLMSAGWTVGDFSV